MAIERLGESRPDLILLDLMMPVMDGFQFVVEMRRVAKWRTIPIVVVTAKNLSEAERRQLQGEVVGLIERGGLARDEFLPHLRELVTTATRADPTPVAG